MGKAFAKDQSGATVIEYAFICAVIVLVMLTSLVVVSNESTAIWRNTSKSVQKYAPD